MNGFTFTLTQAVFSRDNRDGKLEVDDVEEGTGTTSGAATSINIQQPFYVGGIPPAITEEASTNLQVTYFLQLSCLY